MRRLLTLLVWTVLLVLCWPLAFLALVLWPILWLLSIPFRIVAIAVNGAAGFFEGAVIFASANLGASGKGVRRPLNLQVARLPRNVGSNQRPEVKSPHLGKSDPLNFGPRITRMTRMSEWMELAA